MMMSEALVKEIIWMIHIWLHTLFQSVIKQEVCHYHHMSRPK